MSESYRIFQPVSQMDAMIRGAGALLTFGYKLAIQASVSKSVSDRIAGGVAGQPP